MKLKKNARKLVKKQLAKIKDRDKKEVQILKGIHAMVLNKLVLTFFGFREHLDRDIPEHHNMIARKQVAMHNMWINYIKPFHFPASKYKPDPEALNMSIKAMMKT